eukprot:7317664-Ditylum_brightwellii.AAC.1
MDRSVADDTVAKSNVLRAEMNALFTSPKAPKTSGIGPLVINALRAFVMGPSMPTCIPLLSVPCTIPA